MDNLQELKSFRAFKKIEIPIIQRDYVLGRSDAKEVRERFLDDLFNAFENDREFHLDFVYGEKKGDEPFIPIDGQQRLTTLFLLYWYFAKKEGKDYGIDFKYRTRKSAEEFCEFLLEIEKKDIDFSQDKISSQLKNNKKFIPFWEYDPTVESMLTVLDEIHKRGKDKEYFDRLEKVRFSIFVLDSFTHEQTEELYRKMNSRGKVLTELENFKTMYEQIAYKKSNYKRIAEKFEKKWSEFFWKHKDSSCLIDNPFMNLIKFITEMKSYEDGKKYGEVDAKSFNYLREFYKNENNFSFLESCLDNLEKIEKIAEHVKRNFTFFEKRKSVNLFTEIIENYNDMTITNKILAYLMIRSAVKITDIENDPNRIKILDLLRIARNDLYRQRALKTAQIEYTSTIENKDIPQLIKNYMPLFVNINDKSPYETILEETLETESLKHEQEKAKLIINNGIKQEIQTLEDFIYMKGDLRVFLSDECNFIEDKADRIKFLIKEFIPMFDNPDDLICRALLAVGDHKINYKVHLGTVCRGSKYFFGQKGYWEIFFTYNTKQANVTKIYSRFFSKLLKNYTLQQIINEKLETYENKNKDWIYYFLRYPIMLTHFKSINNIFGWIREWDENDSSNNRDENDNLNNTGFIEKLEKETRITGKHVNVFLLAILSDLRGDLDKIQDLQEYLHNDDDCSTGYLAYKGKEVRIDKDKIIVDDEEVPLYEKDDAIKKTKALLVNIKD